MKHDDFNAMLVRLGLSQAGACRLLGITDRTVRRWSKGDQPIPNPASRFLTYLLATGADPEKVRTIVTGIPAMPPRTIEPVRTPEADAPKTNWKADDF